MSEIRMLNLFRCCTMEDMRENKESTGRVNCIVMDYFDNIYVETLDWEKATLSECMGIKQSANGKKGVSNQRYCLYSSENNSEDMFELSDEYPILTVIQLFVNPDIYQAETFDNREKVCARTWIERLKKCIMALDFSGQKVKWKIYQLLTAGDFAIIVRSQKIHAAYDISTVVRGIRLIPSDLNEKERAAFYSYSICGVLDNDEKKSETFNWQQCLDPSDRVVIRIRYKQTFREYLPKASEMKQNILNVGKHLFGRYDHQFICTPEEFGQLFPILKRFKFNREEITEKDKKGNENLLVCTIIDMMIGGYVSHINEKLLLHYDTDVYLEGTTTEKWKLKVERWESLYKRNNKIIERLKETVANLEKDMESYYQSAGNLKEYTRLLGRLCRVFYEINKMQELRISVAHLLIQYKDMINSLQAYIKQIEGGNIKIYADEIEENLRYGIGALEIFTRYISNVNLQTLQTPNYDLQTNMCVEKVLLAYSQFLRPYMDGEEKPYHLLEKMYPIIVPGMRVKDLSVVVLFRDMYDIDQEKLMVVYSPTISFLCETCFMIPSAFHEIAHSFTYKNHKEQNDYLKKHILKGFLNAIITNLLEPYREYDISDTPIIEKLVDIAYNKVLQNLVEIKDEDADQQIVKIKLGEALTYFVSSISKMEGFVFTDRVASEYIEKTYKNIQKYDSRILNILQMIDDSVHKIRDVRSEFIAYADEEKLLDEWKKLRPEIRHRVMMLKMIQEQQVCIEILDKLDQTGKSNLAEKYRKIWDNLSWQEPKEVIVDKEDFWNNQCAVEKLKEIFQLWNEQTKNWDQKEKEEIIYLLDQYRNINSAYSYFADKMEELDSEQIREKYKSFARDLKSQEMFQELCKVIYDKIQKELENIARENNEILDYETPFIPVEQINHITKEIRLQGIEGMQKRVQRILQNYGEDRVWDYVMKQVALYREVTSDLFMCVMMDLNLWGYLVVAAEIFTFREHNSGFLFYRISMILQCLSVGAGQKVDDEKQFKKNLQDMAIAETKLLVSGICETMKTNQEAREKLSAWIENAETDSFDGVLHFFSLFPKETGLTSTQNWIIRIYHQIVYIIANVMNAYIYQNMVTDKDIWKSYMLEDAYINKKEELRAMLEQSGGARLCESITEILNSPAKFFVNKKSLLWDEIKFILSEYEKSCRNIFSERPA